MSEGQEALRVASTTPPSASLDLNMNTCRYVPALNRASPESEYRQEESMAPAQPTEIMI